MITAMAKFRVWARNKYAKVRAWFYSKFRTVAQFFARLWSFLLTHWKWGAGAVAVFGIPAVFYYRDIIAGEAGYTTPLIEMTGMSPGVRFFRDFMVGVAAFVGLVLAGLRVAAMDTQAQTAVDNTNIEKQKVQAAEISSFRKQFASAEKMLTEKATAQSARITGMNTMGDLVKKSPKEFAERAVKTLIVYIKSYAQETAKSPTQNTFWYPELQGKKEIRLLGDDVKTAFMVLNEILLNKSAREEVQDDVLDFSHQDFSNLSFWEVRLGHYTRWIETNFRGSFLYYSSFLKGAHFWRADFQGANLQHSGLVGAHMAGAILTEAKLSYAQMQGAILANADLRGADLSRADMDGVQLGSAKLQGADLSHAQLNKDHGSNRHAFLGNAKLEGANLEGASLRKADLQGACLYGVNLNADLWGANLKRAEFGDTYMPDVEFETGKELPPEVKEAMNGKIWDSVFIDSWREGIRKRPEDAEWDLSKYKDPHALAGILRIFAKPGVFHPGGMNLRRQVRQLLDDGKLPQGMPEELVEWLEGIDIKTGMHSDGK